MATNYPSAMAWHKFDRGWDAYKRAEVYSERVVAQKESRGNNVGPHYKVVYCIYMHETVDGEASPEGETYMSDSRGNYPNGAHSPHGHLHHELEEDYSPSFLYDGLAAEAVAPRAPQAEINDEWGWMPGYSILHTGPCDRCEGYQQHLATAIGIGVPLAVTAGNYPRDMVQRERNHIWAMIEGVWERNDWTMIQRDSKGEISLGPPIVPDAVRMPRDEEIPLMIPQEDAGSLPSPETIRTALTDNDNMSEGPVPSALTSDTGEEQPQNQTEATVLHYCNDSVVIICGNGQETVLTSQSWNRDRDPTQIYTRMAAMDTEPLPHAFRYALNANDTSTSALRPLVPADSWACVIVETLIDGHKALTMLDTGSTSNFVSLAFAMVHRIHAFPLEQQLTLQLGCVGSRSRITHGANAQMQIGAFDAQLYFDIANIDQYDCILGIPFLWQNVVIVNFGWQVLRIERGDILMIQDSETMTAHPTRMRCPVSGCPRND